MFLPFKKWFSLVYHTKMEKDMEFLFFYAIMYLHCILAMRNDSKEELYYENE